jgi:hypothetical protein
MCVLTHLLTDMLSSFHSSSSQGEGQVSGTISTDVIAIGNLAVAAQSFGAVSYESDDFNDAPNDGLIGLAFGTIAQSKKPTFFENLIEAKKVAAPLFSVHLTRNQASGSEVSWVLFNWKMCLILRCKRYVSDAMMRPKL